jgi:hypothetical protein
LAIGPPGTGLQVRRRTRHALVAGACLLFGCASVAAQTVYPPADPFSPKPTVRPQPFQTPAQTSRAGAQTLTFVPPASGAGRTGYDSTNARKRKAPRKPRQAIAPGTPQQPPTSLAPPAQSAFASAPGDPPVEIGPIRKPPKRKAHVEPPDPYEQLGLRAGAFDLYPAVELIGGYNSNPGQTPDGRGAALYSVAPELRLQSHWIRHELKADLRGSYTGYSPDEEPTLSRPYFNGKVDGRLDVAESLRVNGNARALVSTDNPGSPNLQAGLAKLPVFTTYGGGAGVTKSFNRLDFTLKGDAERTIYQNSLLTDGTIVSNADRQYNQLSGAVRAGYELSPGLKPFVEASTDTRKHDLPVDAFGYQRDSKGVSASAGASFEMRGFLTGEASAGYAQRDYVDPRFDRLAGLIGNASLVWTVDALTTVKFTASSVIGESNITGVPGIFSRDAGIQIDHAFRRWLIGTLKFGIGLDTYKGSNSGGLAPVCDCVQSDPGSNVADRVDNRYSAGLGLTYKLDRTTQIKGEFRQDWLRSNVSGVDYTASTFLVGLRLQR